MSTLFLLFFFYIKTLRKNVSQSQDNESIVISLYYSALLTLLCKTDR